MFEDEEWSCEHQIKLGKQHGVDTRVYNKDYFTAEQMRYIRITMEAELNPTKLLVAEDTDDVTLKKLKKIFKKAGKSEDLEKYLTCPKMVSELLEDDYNLIIDFMSD